MKKLIIAAAIVCAAAISQAATVSWTITGVKENETALTKGRTYMFFAGSAADATTEMNAIKALATKGATAVLKGLDGNAWTDTKKATAAGAFSIGTTSAMGGYAALPTNADLGLADGTKYYAYAVIFDTEDVTDKSNYMIVTGNGPTVTGVTTKSGTQNLAVMFGAQTTQSSTWYAVGNVPEPTSAMLLLLGVAGLALKRKQK